MMSYNFLFNYAINLKTTIKDNDQYLKEVFDLYPCTQFTKTQLDFIYILNSLSEQELNLLYELTNLDIATNFDIYMNTLTHFFKNNTIDICESITKMLFELLFEILAEKPSNDDIDEKLEKINNNINTLAFITWLKK